MASRRLWSPPKALWVDDQITASHIAKSKLAVRWLIRIGPFEEWNRRYRIGDALMNATRSDSDFAIDMIATKSSGGKSSKGHNGATRLQAESVIDSIASQTRNVFLRALVFDTMDALFN